MTVLRRLGRVLWWLIFPPAALLGLWWFLVHGRAHHPLMDTLRRHQYAHRGLHDSEVPENSMAGFRLAIQHGYGAELDVHLTRDGRLAVIHDSFLRRLAGVDTRVEDLKADEVTRLTILGSQEHVPLLEDVLPLFEGATPLIVEIKPRSGNHAALTRATVECLDRFDLDYCIESFDPRVLLWLRRHRPEIMRGQLTEDFLTRSPDAPIPYIVRLLLTGLLANVATRPDFVAIRLEDRANWSHQMFWRWWGAQGFYWTITTGADQAIADEDDHLIIFEGYLPKPAE